MAHQFGDLLILTRTNSVYHAEKPTGTNTAVITRLGGGRLEIDLEKGEWRLLDSRNREYKHDRIGNGRAPDHHADGIVGVYTRSLRDINSMFGVIFSDHVRDLPSAD